MTPRPRFRRLRLALLPAVAVACALTAMFVPAAYGAVSHVSLQVMPDQPTVGQSTQLTVTGVATAPPLADAHWQIDGQALLSTATTVTHTFSQPGPVRISVDVVDGDGIRSVQAVRDVQVLPRPVVANLASSARTIGVGQQVLLSTQGTTSPDGGIVQLDWDFDGDGLTDEVQHTAAGACPGASPACTNPALPHAASWPAAGVKLVTVRARDSFGQTASATAQVVVVAGGVAPRAATRASVSLIGLAFVEPFLTTRSFPVRWAVDDAQALGGGGQVVLRMRSASSSTGDWTRWRQWHATPAVTTGDRRFRGKRGRTYCFEARLLTQSQALATAADMRRSQRCVAVPRDDRSLRGDGSWEQHRGRGWYGRTVTSTSRRGATIRAGVVGQRIALLAGTCDGCGTVRINLGRRRLRTVSLDSGEAGIQRRQILPVATFSARRGGRIRIVVVSHDKPVYIDGLAVAAT